jgi:radical SAM superfamily enzyme YgiQ (UPF0313 family)
MKGSSVNILLINPPSAFLIDDRVFPSLGVLKVAASLEQAGHIAKVLDLSGFENYLEHTKSFLSDCTFDAIGITAVTPQMPVVMRILEVIRSVTSTKVILGGPHATLTFAAAKGETKRGVAGRGHRAAETLTNAFDTVILGDGEISIHTAISQPVKVLDGDDRKSEFWLTDSVYEETKPPARHLIDLNSYKYTIEGHPATSIIAQLGCPFHCGFCGGRNSPSLRFIRTRSVSSILDEVRFLYKTYGYTGFMFYDDELNVNPKLIDLMRGLKDLQSGLGEDFKFRGFVKAELFTKEQAVAMYAAGFRWLLCGFEAADERILTNIRKRATKADNTRMIETAKSAGVKVKALMSIGHPGESHNTIDAIRDWLIEVGADDFDCTVITPFPGTPYHDESVFDGEFWAYTQPDTKDKLYSVEVDYSKVAEYYKGIPGEYVSVVHTDYLTEKEIVNHRDQLETEVRNKLDIPFQKSTAEMQHEHSMGIAPLSKQGELK